ncbi:hypothetical protein AB0K00_39095 [Dactylosporangium sp. NPDC049525]|uniref:hypothetical protein n=1 Tax=Dactylosporangium sp. NPDC049525 TaxID=3154730 RepID=UPI00341B4503
MTRRSLAVALAVGALLAAPVAASAGCSPSHDAAPSASSTAGGNTQRMLDVGRQFAQCARDHGYPGFPDPDVDGGRLVWPADTGIGLKDQINKIGEIPECRAISDQMGALGTRHTPSIGPSDLPKLRDFAECMRAHGLPDFPDPKPDGSFQITGTPLQGQDQSETWMAGIDACKQHLADKRIVTT